MRLNQIFYYPQLFISVDGKMYFRDLTSFVHSSDAGRMDVTATSEIYLNAPIVGIPNKLVHDGDVNTYLIFGIDSIRFYAGAAETLALDEAGSVARVGFYGVTPAVKGAAIADATDAATAISQLNLLLAQLRTYGLLTP